MEIRSGVNKRVARSGLITRAGIGVRCRVVSVRFAHRPGTIGLLVVIEQIVLDIDTAVRTARVVIEKKSVGIHPVGDPVGDSVVVDQQTVVGRTKIGDDSVIKAWSRPAAILAGARFRGIKSVAVDLNVGIGVGASAGIRHASCPSAIEQSVVPKNRIGISSESDILSVAGRTRKIFRHCVVLKNHVFRVVQLHVVHLPQVHILDSLVAAGLKKDRIVANGNAVRSLNLYIAEGASRASVGGANFVATTTAAVDLQPVTALGKGRPVLPIQSPIVRGNAQRSRHYRLADHAAGVKSGISAVICGCDAFECDDRSGRVCLTKRRRGVASCSNVVGVTAYHRGTCTASAESATSIVPVRSALVAGAGWSDCVTSPPCGRREQGKSQYPENAEEEEFFHLDAPWPVVDFTAVRKLVPVRELAVVDIYEYQRGERACRLSKVHLVI